MFKSEHEHVVVIQLVIVSDGARVCVCLRYACVRVCVCVFQIGECVYAELLTVTLQDQDEVRGTITLYHVVQIAGRRE